MGIAIRVIAVLMLILGTTVCSHAQWPLGQQVKIKPATPSPSVTAGGRFQVFTSPNLKGKTFMLDSDTGKVWVFHKDHSTGDFALKRIPVAEVDKKKPNEKVGSGTSDKDSKTEKEKGTVKTGSGKETK